jgi:hypothetical protein
MACIGPNGQLLRNPVSLKIPTNGLAQDEKKFSLFRVHIHLEDAECIPLGIDEIALPTSLWDREFGQCHNAPDLFDYLCRLIKILHFQRTDKRIRAALRWWSSCGALQQSAPRPSGLNSPVGNWKAFHFVELPPEDL